MCPTMDQTTMLLQFIMPILKGKVGCVFYISIQQISEEDPELHEFLIESDVGTIFALSWLITWYGHVISEHKYIVRLFDFFVATHPLMPLYIAAAMGKPPDSLL